MTAMIDAGTPQPTPEHEASGVISTGYSCVVVRARDDDQLVSVEPPNSTLVTVPDQADDVGGDLWVNTADQFGPFHVATRRFAAEPGDPGPEWEDVVEVSMITQGKVVVTEMVDNNPQIDLLNEPGEYRLRVSARGRRIRDFADDDDEEEFDDGPPKEWYLLEVWPAPVTDPVVVRLTSPFALYELNPPPPLVIPAGEAGLAAAGRIGRDVDGTPGARILSGEVGSVHVERTIRGTRRRLFGLCSHLLTWSATWIEGSSWSYSVRGMSPDGDEYALDNAHRGYSHKHADQLTGRTGLIQYSFVEVDKPHRAVRDFQWYFNQNRPDLMWPEEPEPFLPVPTRMTVTLVQSRDDAGDPWTTISIDHDQLPVEWLEDMETYWNYQLSIADHAQFGVPKEPLQS